MERISSPTSIHRTPTDPDTDPMTPRAFSANDYDNNSQLVNALANYLQQELIILHQHAIGAYD
jgi:methionine synthase II (cobalamin-independent)